MNYAKEREIARKKKLKAKIIVFTIVTACILALSVFSFFVPMPTWKNRVNLPNVGKRADKELRMHFINVGQGDATVIEFPDGKIALIDGGDDTETNKTRLLRYLNALKIDQIDYLIVTHADADHCGGLDEVVKQKRILQAFVPDINVSTGVQYQEFYGVLEKEKCEIIPVARKRIVNATEETPYTFSILYPYANSVSGTVNNDNERSGVVWLEYQGVGAIFMGDAPAEVETALKNQAKNGLLQTFAPNLHSTEIIKVSHHGSNTATSGEFLEYIQAKTAIISCGKNNVYGHPNTETLNTLQEKDVETYRTDTQGHIIVTVQEGDTQYSVRALTK